MVISLTVALLGVMLYFISTSGIFNIDIPALVETIRSYGTWSRIIYMVLFFVLIMIGFSMTALTVAGGIVFGFWEGVLLTSLMVNISCLAAYSSAQMFHRLTQRHVNFFMKHDFKHTKNMITGLKEKIKHLAFTHILLLRFIAPTVPVSYGLGFLDEDIEWSFIGATLLGNTVVCFVFIFFGAAITENLALFSLAFVLLMGLLGVQHYLHQRHLNQHTSG